ncbi:MAG: helix-turn-helix domain-containing protein [Clostridia bacterium]|nr:helix-turn-helix domain-containing protein [Clostridia bacterium]
MRIFDLPKNESLNVNKESRPITRTENEHKHEFIELVYTARGSCTHFINGTPYSVSRGDMLFINYGETHSFQPESDVVFYNFFVKPEFMSENLVNSENINDIFLIFLPESTEELQKRRTSCVRFSVEERTEIEETAERMLNEQSEARPCAGVVLNAYMRLIFAKLIRALLEQGGIKRPKLLTDEVLEYIDRNFTSPITAETLAKHCFYNPAYLGRVFKTVYGKSMKDYIRIKRMEYAMELLTSTSLSVEEIGARVGYSGKTQFYKNFKTHYGMLPGEVRK